MHENPHKGPAMCWVIILRTLTSAGGSKCGCYDNNNHQRSHHPGASSVSSSLHCDGYADVIILQEHFSILENTYELLFVPLLVEQL